MKRILDMDASELNGLSPADKLKSIQAAEGRTVVSEVIVAYPPVLGDISNVELACSFGADILLLNLYDVENPRVMGIPEPLDCSIIQQIKKMTGRMVAVNLEPVDPEALMLEERTELPAGRLASVENVKRLIAQGADFVVLTGNPKTGVTNQQIIKVIQAIKKAECDILIIAGKMHAAGAAEGLEPIVDESTVNAFIDAGTDILLLPAPGTVPGLMPEQAHRLIALAHKRNTMVMTTIGTSQEGADEATIKAIALNCKMAGADMHHIGDCGMSPGIATPENIMIYSIAIKGKRHTYRRMARSVNR